MMPWSNRSIYVLFYHGFVLKHLKKGHSCSSNVTYYKVGALEHAFCLNVCELQHHYCFYGITPLYTMYYMRRFFFMIFGYFDETCQYKKCENSGRECLFHCHYNCRVSRDIGFKIKFYMFFFSPLPPYPQFITLLKKLYFLPLNKNIYSSSVPIVSVIPVVKLQIIH